MLVRRPAGALPLNSRRTVEPSRLSCVLFLHLFLTLVITCLAEDDTSGFQTQSYNGQGDEKSAFYGLSPDETPEVSTFLEKLRTQGPHEESDVSESWEVYKGLFPGGEIRTLKGIRGPRVPLGVMPGESSLEVKTYYREVTEMGGKLSWIELVMEAGYNDGNKFTGEADIRLHSGKNVYGELVTHPVEAQPGYNIVAIENANFVDGK